MEYIVKTNNLTKIYKGKEVVKNVSMSIRKGEIYGFLGPNGAGKTTIMKMLTNLVKPTSGEIEIFGGKLANSSFDILKKMGSIIEYPVFYDKLSAHENLKLHCEYMGYDHKDEIDNVLKMVNLTDIDGKSVKEFSLGMKQRLGIARAILTKPELLILDEPINGLDPVGIRELRNLFTTLRDEFGITILISSHILGEIELIANTIGVISEGRLMKEVATEQIRQQNNEFIELSVNDIKKAIYILENHLNIHKYEVENNVIKVFDQEVSQSVITKTLIMNEVEVLSINKMNLSLEDYFVNLINGGEISA